MLRRLKLQMLYAGEPVELLMWEFFFSLFNATQTRSGLEISTFLYFFVIITITLLMLKVLSKVAAEDILFFIFHYFFREKTRDFM